jgi:hypothetical protein
VRTSYTLPMTSPQGLRDIVPKCVSNPLGFPLELRRGWPRRDRWIHDQVKSSRPASSIPERLRNCARSMFSSTDTSASIERVAGAKA